MRAWSNLLKEWTELIDFSSGESKIGQISCPIEWDYSKFLWEEASVAKVVARVGLVVRFPAEVGRIKLTFCRSGWNFLESSRDWFQIFCRSSKDWSNFLRKAVRNDQTCANVQRLVKLWSNKQVWSKFWQKQSELAKRLAGIIGIGQTFWEQICFRSVSAGLGGIGQTFFRHEQDLAIFLK